jgi:hypothetical protein
MSQPEAQVQEYVGKHRAPMTQEEFYADMDIWETEFDDPNEAQEN